MNKDNLDTEITVCYLCQNGNYEEVLLLCDGCELAYHTYCLNMSSVPDGNWHCPRCNFGNLSLDLQDKDEKKKEEPIRTAVIYERVSSAGQDKPEFGRVGMQTQNMSVLEYCKDKNLLIKATYTDVGTGRNINNLTGFMKMAKELKPKTEIVVYSASRIGRNYQQVQNFLNAIHAKDCYVYSVSDKMSSQMSGFMDLVRQSEKESINLSKTIMASINRRKRLGGHIGKAPYGYMLQRDFSGISKLKPHPAEQQILTLIRKHKTDGFDNYYIANELNKMGKRYHGSHWKRQNISYLLKKKI